MHARTRAWTEAFQTVGFGSLGRKYSKSVSFGGKIVLESKRLAI